MPQPLVFAACEKVIISQEENNPTLISIISEVGGSIEIPQLPPSEKVLVAPVRWQVFTLWSQEPTDGDRVFEQLVKFISPSGKNHFASGGADKPLALDFKGRTHRVTATVPGLPATENGEWTLQLFVRERGSEWPAEPIRTYPLTLKFTVEVVPAT